MPAYVHINLRVIDAAKQAALAPRFQAALKRRARGFYTSVLLRRFLRARSLCRWPACLSFQPSPKR
jgi:hypothetical protein